MEVMMLIVLLVLIILLFFAFLNGDGRRIEERSRRRQIASWRAAGVSEETIQEVLKLERERDLKQ